jgi:LPXTG-motif cell wall-anchored protein
VVRGDYGRLMTDEPWDDPDDDQDLPRSSSGAYPLPDATIAGHETVLAGLAAAILGVLLFWRRKRPAEEEQ